MEFKSLKNIETSEKLESPAMTNKTIVLDAETVYRESTL